MQRGHDRTDKTLNVLLVEDSETDAYVVSRVLGKCMVHECAIHRAKTMGEAEEALKEKGAVDLILLDLGLPDTNGGEDTFQRICAVKSDLPVIVLTSVTDHELAVNIVGEGAQDYVRKSVISSNPDILCDAIDFAVCRHRNMETLLEEKDQVIGWMSGDYSVK